MRSGWHTKALAALIFIFGAVVLPGGLGGGFSGFANAAAPDNPFTTGLLTYHGGDLMASPTNYVIFWLPNSGPGAPWHYEPSSSTKSDADFENTIDNYFTDICPSPLYNYLTEYDQSGSGDPILNACQFGGSYVDTTPYPNAANDATTAGNYIPDNGSNSIQSAMRSSRAHFGSGSDTNTEYFVYIGDNAQECRTTARRTPTAMQRIPGPGVLTRFARTTRSGGECTVAIGHRESAWLWPRTVPKREEYRYES